MPRAGVGCAVVLLVAATLVFASAARADHWSRGPDLANPRSTAATATLHDGSVLIIGGAVLDANVTNPSSATVLRYDPVANTFSQVASMHEGRTGAVAITLADGRVLVAGGTGVVNNNTVQFLDGEVYDPATNQWTMATGVTSVPRTRAGLDSDATLLPDGRVLFATDNAGPSAAVDVYDPTTNAFSAVKPLSHARAASSQTLLPGGKVLVAGGRDNGGPVNTGEVYDPGNDAWTDTANDLPEAHLGAMLQTLSNGKALIAGGATFDSGNPATTTTADLYDPAANAFTATGRMHSAHLIGGDVPLPDGRILAMGGAAQGTVPPTPVDDTETYSPATGTWTDVAPMDTAWLFPSPAVLPDGRVLVCCGVENAVSVAGTRTQIYTPSYLPSAPQNVSAVAGDASATVSWAPPASNGDNPILSYTVTTSTGQQFGTPDASTSLHVAGLANGTPVTFTVTARTAFGTGPASAPSAAVTPTHPGGAPDKTAPTVKVSGLKRKLTRKALLKGLKFTVTPSEPAKLSITLLGSKKTKKPRYTVKLASKSFKLGGKHKLTLKPKSSRVNHAKKFSVKLRIVATDAAGNKATITKTIRISG